MNIEDYRAANNIETIQDVARAEVAAAEVSGPPVPVTVSSSYEEETPIRFGYRGYWIYRSPYSGRWWVMDTDNMHQGWCSDYHDGRALIDIMVERKEAL